ncbi:hypothetical protein HK405_015604, partial [Cladochytrium tenue]
WHEGGGGSSLRDEVNASNAHTRPSRASNVSAAPAQHVLIRHALGGLFHTPQEALLAGGGARVLDVGCGPGHWTMEMARKFPLTRFSAV